MDEGAALAWIADRLPRAGDDAAVIDGLVVTTDMLHDRTDFPDGTTRYTAGWRAVGASLSDVAATGGEAVATVAVYAAPEFSESGLHDFVDGAVDVSALTDAEYVGGDLDEHGEFTVATTAIGRTEDPVTRGGARPGDAVCVTGTLGRSAAALSLFERGEVERANDLFRFPPRVAAGRQLATEATAMIDSSDGLARSLHQVAAASDCGFDLEGPIPVDDALREVADDEDEAIERALFFGEDFELVATLTPDAVASTRSELSCELTRIGTVTESPEGDAPRVRLDGEPLPDRGYTHGE